MCIPLNNTDWKIYVYVTNLKYIITVCYDVIILYNFLPMHSFFFPLVYIMERKLSKISSYSRLYMKPLDEPITTGVIPISLPVLSTELVG